MQVLTTTPFLPTGGVRAHGSVRGRRACKCSPRRLFSPQVACQHTDLSEGDVVRILSRTEELCKEVRARRRGSSAMRCSLGGCMQALTTALTTAHHCSSLSPAQVRAAARLLGDALLAKKLDELLAAIRRDLVVTPSLYTTGGLAGW